MKRIDKYKNRLEKIFNESESGEKQLMVFQELMNLLTTYDEKKEFYDYFEKLKNESPVVAR